MTQKEWQDRNGLKGIETYEQYLGNLYHKYKK